MKTLDDVRKGYIGRTDIIASSAAYTHLIVRGKAFFEIIYLVHGFKAHTVLILIPKGMTAVYRREIIVHTARPCPAAFSALSVFRIGRIHRVEAGTGDADRIAGTAADTAALIVLPHIQCTDGVYHILTDIRHLYGRFVFPDKFRLKFCMFKC